mmetsp:Transcript_59831/g.142518  ORF Transcript_59831/g.142518 Transcript_59831/m.142518 type:complete len:895 (-) Transcript_59831:55-2739(-)
MAAELAVAAAAGVVGGVRGVWGYNRTNFMYDREMRQKTEFQVVGYRNTQSSLWREDVRDLIGLTERKMDSYLIVNTLQLGMCVMLFAEGRLDPGTPDWILHIYMLALGAAFLYLLTSVWLAMHASIVAQVSGVKLLTQHVRLPVPTIDELTSMRTYALCYENLDVKSMMRVPFIGKSGRRKASAETATDAESSVGSEAGRPPSRKSVPTDAESAAAAAAALPVDDPWGLEAPNCPYELESMPPAHREHIKQVAQQAIAYQSFDAFARVSMSFGTNQLLCAITYYCLGYVSVLDGAPFGSAMVTVIMVVIAVAIIELDLDLTRMEALVAKVVLASGPAIFTVAACLWCWQHSFARIAVPILLPLGFAAHGTSLVWLLRSLHVEKHDNGAWMPTKFVAVKNVDVFGWLTAAADSELADESSFDIEEPESLGEEQQKLLSHYSGRSWGRRLSQENVQAHCRGTQGTDARSTLQERIQDALHGHNEGYTAGAGRTHGGLKKALNSADKHTSGRIPWLALKAGTRLLICLWIVGFLWSLGHLLETGVPLMIGASSGTLSGSRSEVSSYKDLSSAQPSSVPLLGEAVEIAVHWPRRSTFAPMAVSCDPTGQQLVVADEFGLYAGSLQQPEDVEAKPANLTLERVLPCPAFEGHTIQDISVACDASLHPACSVLVLHKHGDSLTDCPLILRDAKPEQSKVSKAHDVRHAITTTWTLSQEWVEAPSEEVTAVAVDADCLRRTLEQGSASPAATQSGRGCVVTGTSTGRIVRLRRHLAMERQLVPDVDIQQQRASNESPPGLMHHFQGSTVLVLWPDDGRIQALDLQAGDLVGEWRLPKDRHWISLAGSDKHLFLLAQRKPASSSDRKASLWRFTVPDDLQKILQGAMPASQGDAGGAHSEEM